MERSILRLDGLSVGVGAATEKQADGVHISLPGGVMERVEALSVRNVDGGAGFEQQRQDPDVAAERRVMKGRESVVVLSVDVVFLGGRRGRRRARKPDLARFALLSGEKFLERGDVLGSDGGENILVIFAHDCDGVMMRMRSGWS